MPRYFFDIEDGRPLADTVGVELADLVEAQQASADLASDLLLNAPDVFWNGRPCRLVVRDEWGLVVLKLDMVAERTPAACQTRAEPAPA